MKIKKPNFNINLNLNFDLKDFEKKMKKAPVFLDSKRRNVIIIIALFLIGYCVYEYYVYIYHPAWSAKQKQDYINTKEKDAVFDDKNFNAVISEIEKRKVEFVIDYSKSAKDIFKVNQ